MGETAEKVAEQYGVTRAAQDAFALRSQQRGAAAATGGPLRRTSSSPVEVPARKGAAAAVVEVDEHPRPETTLEELAALRAGVPPRTAR